MSDSIPSINTDLPEEDLRIRLNRETSKIGWDELQKFYAKGMVIHVGQGVDLIDVAITVSEDNKEAVEQWMADGTLSQVTDEQALSWHEQDIIHWAVVIAPWVLVQQVKEETAH
ncbi:MAG: hypothetical protein ACJA0N_000187 [Pseudohongiellaceae bacterium]|jgi:hypothetical protein